jgi:hypothetical protein
LLLRIFLLLVISTFILTKNSYSSYFFYEIYLGPIKVGESQISISKNSNTLSAKVYTTGLGNIIYPYYATWETKVDKNGYPIQTTIYSKERSKERKKILHFDSNNLVVYEEKILPEKESKTIIVSFPIHDELSGFISVWNWSKLPQKSSIPLYIKNERTFATVEIQTKEPCEFLNKKIMCQTIKVTLPEKSELLKRSKNVIIYMHPEGNFPVIIKGSLPLFGSLKAVLKNFSP